MSAYPIIDPNLTEIGAISVDSGQAYVGSSNRYDEGEHLYQECWPSFSSPEAIEAMPGAICSTGIGDGIYRVYAGSGHALDPQAQVVLEFLPSTYMETHEDIDGVIEYPVDLFDPADAFVAYEKILVLDESDKLMVKGDPYSYSFDPVYADLPAGEYHVRVWHATMLEERAEWGPRNVAVTVTRI